MTEQAPFRPLAPALLRGWRWSQRLRDKPELMRWLGESGQVVTAGSGTKSLLFQPKGLQLNALFGCVGARGLRIGAENEVCWIRLGERMGMGSDTSAMAGTRPGAKFGLGDFFSPFPLLSPVASPRHSTTPALHFSTIPCNLCRRFPLYGVEAGGLPARAVQR